MDERKVSKARMWLVTSGCPRIRAPSSSMPRGKNGARPPLSHRPRTRPPHVQTPRGRLHQTVRSMLGFSWFLTRSSIQVQAWPVHQTRPNRGAGSGRLGPWDSKTSSSREVSRDSQRLRRFSLAFPAHARLQARLLIPPQKKFVREKKKFCNFFFQKNFDFIFLAFLHARRSSLVYSIVVQ